jgi:hypothetical protein
MRPDPWLGAGLLLLGPLWTGPQTSGVCSGEAAASIATAAGLMDAADEHAAERRLREAASVEPLCAPLTVAADALAGYTAALRAAVRGGPPDLLAPVEEAIARLDDWRRLPGAMREAEYAQAALRGAMAAAHDERQELALWLAHTRDLSARLDLAGERLRWPLPAGVLAGDLWSEVDRHDDALVGYGEAIAGEPTAYALRGRARTLDRMGRVDAACQAYRDLAGWFAARQIESPALAEARSYLDRPTCGPH